MGTAGACPLVGGAGPGLPPGGRAVLRDLSGGDCVQEVLGSLSADEWCCVTAIFVVWPEAS